MFQNKLLLEKGILKRDNAIGHSYSLAKVVKSDLNFKYRIQNTLFVENSLCEEIVPIYP